MSYEEIYDLLVAFVVCVLGITTIVAVCEKMVEAMQELDEEEEDECGQ